MGLHSFCIVNTIKKQSFCIIEALRDFKKRKGVLLKGVGGSMHVFCLFCNGFHRFHAKLKLGQPGPRSIRYNVFAPRCALSPFERWPDKLSNKSGHSDTSVQDSMMLSANLSQESAMERKAQLEGIPRTKVSKRRAPREA